MYKYIYYNNKKTTKNTPMKGIKICPDCGQPTLKIKENTVKNLVKSSDKINQTKGKWQLCVDKECETVYISGESNLKKDDLKYSLFFKDNTDNAIICYCYDISRAEMKSAVEKGCRTKGDICKLFKKKKSGSCETSNPLGKSCSEVFNFELNKIMK